jgi:hypothetical protein
MTYAQRILDYLWSVAPVGASNGQIAQRLGIESHQTVYMVTQELLRKGLVRGEQPGRTWVFHAVEEPSASSGSPSGSPRTILTTGQALAPTAFETLARRLLGEHYAATLMPGSVPGIRKRFDFVSPDRQIVGDAKYYPRVGGVVLPPAKFSIIAEHVWLLEKTGARTGFLVFGGDRQVPVLWLDRYGTLAPAVIFYLLGKVLAALLADEGIGRVVAQQTEWLESPDRPVRPWRLLVLLVEGLQANAA